MPQDNILGSLLFVVHTNDFAGIFDPTRYHLVMYADDTNILVKGENPHSSIESTKAVLHNVSQWFAQNKLALNVKTCIMFSASSRNLRTQTVQFNNVSIELNSSYKFLSVMLVSRIKLENVVNRVQLENYKKISR